MATSDGTVAFKANMRDGRADLRLTRTAARLSGRFDFRVVIRNGNLWYADRKSTSSTWHAGSDTFAFHNTTKPNHRCVNDTTGVGVNSTKSGVGASMVTWNCATVNRIARGGAESDTAPDVTYHIHVASADEGHPVTVASGTRAFEAYHAYDGTTAGDAFTGPGGGSHVAYTPKRTDGTPTAGEYRLVANADGSYDYDLDIGPREGANANRFTKPAVDATTAELMEASNMLFQVDYGGISINFDSSTEKRSAVVTWTSSERAGGSFLASNTITTNTGRSRALIAYDGNEAGSGGVAPHGRRPGNHGKGGRERLHPYRPHVHRLEHTQGRHGHRLPGERRRRIPGRGADFDPVRAMEADNLHYPLRRQRGHVRHDGRPDRRIRREKDLARQPVRQARQGVRGLEHQDRRERRDV